MEQNTETPRYPDSQIRDMADSWGRFPSERLQPPRALKLLGHDLVGQIYVDRTMGFKLRVECEANFGEDRPVAVVQNLAGAEWDIPYATIRTLPIRRLTRAECKALRLPARPRGLWRHCDSLLAQCRRLDFLDPMRECGNPDILRAWVVRGDNLRSEQILVRVEAEAFPKVFECVVVRAPQRTNCFKGGEKVNVIALAWQGEDDLFCLPSADGQFGKPE